MTMPKAKSRIRVVEDNGDEAKLIQLLPARQGYEGVLAADGKAGFTN